MNNRQGNKIFDALRHLPLLKAMPDPLVVSISSLQQNLSHLLNHLRTHMEPAVISRRGEATHLLIPLDGETDAKVVLAAASKLVTGK